jgi:hypothetical protein
MQGVQNPAIAEIVAQLARGSQSPVKDGTLSSAVQPYSYDRHGGNFEAIPGPASDGGTTPVDTGPVKPGGPQVPLMAVGRAGPSSTMPGPMEGRDFGPSRLSHTGDERGGDQEAVVDMLLAMGLPPEAIQQILMQMAGGRI